MTNTIYWTGVGSRDTPIEIQKLMTSIGRGLSKGNYRFRSGHAAGADTAFENGVPIELRDIFLPKPHFNGSVTGKVLPIHPDAVEIVRQIHPYFGSLKPGTFAYEAHIRNVYQVLGEDINTPSKFLVCWTPDGAENLSESKSVEITGGTRTAIGVAEMYNVPVFNLARPDGLQRLMEYVKHDTLLPRQTWSPDSNYLEQILRAKQLKKRTRSQLKSTTPGTSPHP